MSDVNASAVTDVRPFVPAEDFKQSVAFYTALGWITLWTDDEGLALLSLGGRQIMLQNLYVKDWAENSMLIVEVADALRGTAMSSRPWPTATSAMHGLPRLSSRTGARW